MSAAPNLDSDPLGLEAQCNESADTVQIPHSSAPALSLSPAGHPAIFPSAIQQPPRVRTRSTTINADLSQKQQHLQSMLGLKSFGYYSCAPNGNCGFNALSQLQYSLDKSVNSPLDLPPESQAGQALLRQATATELRSNAVLQNTLCQQEAEILHTWPKELQTEQDAETPVPV